MPGLIVYKSNRAEALANALASVLESPLASPFHPEYIVVQSQGMRRWLSLELARRHGICAHIEFPFPKGFVDQIFSSALDGGVSPEGFDRQTLAWRIMAALPRLVTRAEFGAVERYLNGDKQALKLFQLSERIAHLFDQYIVFRPRLVLGWEKGEDQDWQAILWREVMAHGPRHHQAILGQRLAESLEQRKTSPKKLPERVSIFGISSLPPFYVELLGALSTAVDIHLFLLDPTEHLWAHIISDAEEEGIRRRLQRPTLSTAELHADQKNSLLASLGKTGRDFQNVILDLNPVETHGFYDPPAEENMLGVLQSDIFHLRDPDLKRAVNESDCSIQVHNCHSPLRELEVLHDRLLGLFQTHRALTPKDIVVMMPDVKGYAPYIEAVFGSPESPDRSIPFTIADRGLCSENVFAESLLALLQTTQSRFGAATILRLLEHPALRRRFEFSEADLDVIRSWINQAGICWGIDGQHRHEMGLPDTDQNSWRTGLKRLLLGYALRGDGERLFAGTLPVDDIEGGMARTLGNFVDFAEMLFALREQCSRSHSPEDWCRILIQALENFLAADDRTAGQLRDLRKLILSLKQSATASGFTGTLSNEVIFAQLRRLMEEQESATGFMAGQVTFCALRPMRSVPFKVVCLIGMNDGSFPRPQPLVSFDKIHESPQPGDRSNRFEDRYLFLEALLSAREVLYLSYIGQSVKDNSPLPPSVLVSELLDYLGRSFIATASQGIETRLVTRHRLQAFSSAYFDGESLWSFSEENCIAAQRAVQTRLPAVSFAEQPLTVPVEKKIELATLAQFFANPAEYFARTRLGIQLVRSEATLKEQETIEFDPLARHAVRETIARQRLKGMSEELTNELLDAKGLLPHGNLGRSHARLFASEIEPFVAAVLSRTQKPQAAQIAIQLTMDGWEVNGTVPGPHGDTLVFQRCAKVKARDLLKAWVLHLAANATHPGLSTMVVNCDQTALFRPPPDSQKILSELVALFAQAQSQPLRFFPETSLAFARRKYRPKARQKASAQAMAQSSWIGSDYNGGSPAESDEPYIDLCFRNVPEPLDKEWERVTEAVFVPMFECLEENEL
jgi:exodeoxyribonuclease V gamma subunit